MGRGPVEFRPVAGVPPRPRIRIAEIKPENAVVPQHPADVSKHLDEVGDVFLRRRFHAEHAVDIVSAVRPVGRGGDTIVDRPIVETRQPVHTVHVVYRIECKHYLTF